jgi:hypothetical protein
VAEEVDRCEKHREIVGDRFDYPILGVNMANRIVIFLVGFFLVNAALAEGNSPVNTKEDLLGCWELVDFSAEAKRKINQVEPWPAKYQWFCFEADGTLGSMMSNKPRSVTSAELKKSFAVLPKTLRYEVVRSGLVKTDQDNGGQVIVWLASFMGKDVAFDGKLLKQGTLTMGVYSPAKQDAVYWRYLTKIR